MSDVMEKDTVLEMTRVLAAKPDRVFQAWTDPAVFAQWFGPHGMRCVVDKMDVRPGGAFRAVITGEEDHAIEGVYRTVDAPNRLAFSWAWQQGEIAGHESEVEVTFAAEGDGTRLTLVHRLLPDSRWVDAHGDGWGSTFEKLTALMAA